MDFCPTPDSSRTIASYTVRSDLNITKHYYSLILTPSLDGNRNKELTSIISSTASCELPLFKLLFAPATSGKVPHSQKNLPLSTLVQTSSQTLDGSIALTV